MNEFKNIEDVLLEWGKEDEDQYNYFLDIINYFGEETLAETDKIVQLYWLSIEHCKRANKFIKNIDLDYFNQVKKFEEFLLKEIEVRGSDRSAYLVLHNILGRNGSDTFIELGISLDVIVQSVIDYMENLKNPIKD